jgi:peptidoglycan-associated lipoprotein
MFKEFLRCKSIIGSVFVMTVALLAVGCSKKIAPVGGSTGLSNGLGASTPSNGSSRQTPPGKLGGEERPSSSGEVTEKAMENSVTERGNGRSTRPDKHASTSPMKNNGQDFMKNVYFDYDKALVRSDAKTALEENSRWLALNSSVKIQIEGHGDERGTNDYNLALGERRARSIMRYLVNLGINESRFSFISYGEERGVCSDPNESCYQQNRRVHFIVKK